MTKSKADMPEEEAPATDEEIARILQEGAAFKEGGETPRAKEVVAAAEASDPWADPADARGETAPHEDEPAPKKQKADACCSSPPVVDISGDSDLEQYAAADCELDEFSPSGTRLDGDLVVHECSTRARSSAS